MNRNNERTCRFEMRKVAEKGNSKGMEWDRRGGRQGEEPCTPASSNSDTNTLVCHSVKLLSWSRLIQSWSVAADPSSWQILRGFLRSDDSLWTRSMKAEYFRARSRWFSSSGIDYHLVYLDNSVKDEALRLFRHQMIIDNPWTDYLVDHRINLMIIEWKSWDFIGKLISSLSSTNWQQMILDGAVQI